MKDQDYPEFPAVVDSTIRGTYVACEKKAWWAHFLHWSPKGGSVHLIAGAAFAKGIEVVRREFYEHGTDVDTAVARGALAAFEEYGDFEPPERSPKTPERVAYAIADYFAEYPPATDHIQPYRGADNQPAVEFSFAIPTDVLHPVTQDPILYAGRFDMVGVYGDSIWVVDEKTTTRLGPSWINSFRLRGQLLGYTYAAREFGIPVNGFIVRGVSFLKDKYGHAEVMEKTPDYRLDQWWEQVHQDLEDMKRAWERGYFSFNFGDSCTNYGGCPYMTLCEKSDPESWVDMYFEKSHWSPLDLNPLRTEDPHSTTILKS